MKLSGEAGTDTLQVVAARALEQLAALVYGEGRDTLERVVHLITGIVERSGDLGEVGTLPSSDRRLVRLGRDIFVAELVRYWEEREVPPEPARMLAMLAALERIRGAVEAHSPGDLRAMLSATQELELLVELAHDLRSPLTSILFLSETLQRGQSGPVNTVQHRQLGIVYSAALSLVSLASDVIELARGGDRLVDARPSPFSIRETFDSLCDVVAPLVEEKKLTIRTLGPEEDDRLGNCVALSRVLLNLVTNALSFTDTGFVEITARSLDAMRVEFSVRDTGPGIEPEVLPSLFEPLKRSGSTGRYGFSGSGLGLTICQKLLRAMGSDLEYETAAGWGTRFYFTLALPQAKL